MKQPPESAPEIDGFIKIAPVRPIDAHPIEFFSSLRLGDFVIGPERSRTLLVGLTNPKRLWAGFPPVDRACRFPPRSATEALGYPPIPRGARIHPGGWGGETLSSKPPGET